MFRKVTDNSRKVKLIAMSKFMSKEVAKCASRFPSRVQGRPSQTSKKVKDSPKETMGHPLIHQGFEFILGYIQWFDSYVPRVVKLFKKSCLAEGKQKSSSCPSKRCWDRYLNESQPKLRTKGVCHGLPKLWTYPTGLPYILMAGTVSH